MKKLLTLFLMLISISCFAQNNNKLSKKDIKRMQNELRDLNKSQNDIKFTCINPEVLDEFIISLKERNLNKLYDLTDPQIKNLQSKEDMIKIFGMYDKYYGQITNFERTSFTFQNNPGFGELVQINYKIEFEKYKGKANSVFKVYSKDSLKMFSFNLALDDYTKIETLDSIAKTTLDAVLAKDKKLIYSLTSTRFKEYTPISDFETGISKVLDIEIRNFKAFKYQIGVKGGNEIFMVTYEVNDKAGNLELSFTKLKDKFELEGLFYKPND